VGSRSLVYGASAERETYGQYLDDTRVADDGVSAFVQSEDGVKAQQVWKEVGEKLDKIDSSREEWRRFSVKTAWLLTKASSRVAEPVMRSQELHSPCDHRHSEITEHLSAML
jgi:hypothetical protein